MRKFNLSDSGSVLLIFHSYINYLDHSMVPDILGRGGSKSESVDEFRLISQKKLLLISSYGTLY